MASTATDASPAHRLNAVREVDSELCRLERLVSEGVTVTRTGNARSPRSILSLGAERFRQLCLEALPCP